MIRNATPTLVFFLVVLLLSCAKNEERMTQPTEAKRGERKQTQPAEAKRGERQQTQDSVPTFELNLPMSTWDADKCMTMLQDLGAEYGTYASVRPQDSVAIGELSLEVVNDVKSFPSFLGGGILNADIRDEEAKGAVQSVREPLVLVLKERCQLEEDTQHRLLIRLYYDRVSFDGAGRGRGVIDTQMVLLDTQNQQVLWCSDQAAARGKSFEGALAATVPQIRDEIDALFAGPLEDE